MQQPLRSRALGSHVSSWLPRVSYLQRSPVTVNTLYSISEAVEIQLGFCPHTRLRRILYRPVCVFLFALMAGVGDGVLQKNRINRVYMWGGGGRQKH